MRTFLCHCTPCVLLVLLSAALVGCGEDPTQPGYSEWAIEIPIEVVDSGGAPADGAFVQMFFPLVGRSDSRGAAPPFRVGYSTWWSGPTRLALDVVDLDGTVVRRLFDGVTGDTPTLATWDGRDESGQARAEGLYLLVEYASRDVDLEDVRTASPHPSRWPVLLEGTRSFHIVTSPPRFTSAEGRTHHYGSEYEALRRMEFGQVDRPTQIPASWHPSNRVEFLAGLWREGALELGRASIAASGGAPTESVRIQLSPVSGARIPSPGP